MVELLNPYFFTLPYYVIRVLGDNLGALERKEAPLYNGTIAEKGGGCC